MPVRFVFLTDSHYYPGAPKDYGAPKMLTKSKTVLDAIVPAHCARSIQSNLSSSFTAAISSVVGVRSSCRGQPTCNPLRTLQRLLLALKHRYTVSPAITTPTHKKDPLNRLRKSSRSPKRSRSLTLLHASVSRSPTSITNATQSKQAAAFGPIPSTKPSARKRKKPTTKGVQCCCFSMPGHCQAMKKERGSLTVQTVCWKP